MIPWVSAETMKTEKAFAPATFTYMDTDNLAVTVTASKGTDAQLTQVCHLVASGLGPSATATLATKDHLTAAPSMRRQATLTLAPCRKRRGSKEAGQAYGGRLECAGHTIWMEDAIALGVIAYGLNSRP